MAETATKQMVNGFMALVVHGSSMPVFMVTFVLKSGPLAAHYKLPLNRVIVFHDDMDLPCGVLRLHHKEGDGSHNVLKSVIYHFRGNREFARLRIGIGSPPGQMDPKAFLLQKFNATAQGRIDAALQEGVGALKQLVLKGSTECQMLQ